MYNRCNDLSENDWCIKMWCMLKEYGDSGAFQVGKRGRKRVRGRADGGGDTATESDDDSEAKKPSLPLADRKSLLSVAAQLTVGK